MKQEKVLVFPSKDASKDAQHSLLVSDTYSRMLLSGIGDLAVGFETDPRANHLVVDDLSSYGL